MAEAIAVLGLLASSAQVIDYSALVVRRLHDFMTNVKELPSCFIHINNQLPMLVGIVKSLQKRVSDGDFAPESQHDLERVIGALDQELKSLDAVLCKILPSVRASTWEKGIKAVKSLSAQKSVENFASVIQDYVISLNAFQIAHNSDQMKTLISSIEEKRLEQQVPHPKPAQRPVWMLEYDSDEDFIGREEIMSRLEQRFAAMENRVVIAGIGGVGKSRIAIQYCHEQRRREVESHIFWVHGGSSAKFEASYRKIARLLDLPGREDKEIDSMQLVRDHLSEDSSNTWIMVLDNADDHDLWLKSASTREPSEKSPKPLIEYLPRSLHGQILITTRDNQLAYRLADSKHEPIQITRFGPEEASKLLRAKLSEGGTLGLKDANELSAVLEYLPLTITQAAAYLNQIETTATEYLKLFRAGISDIPELLGESVDDPSRDRETSNSIFQTWRLSFEQILKRNPRAAEILSVMSMLDRQGVSQGLLQKPNESLIQFRAAISNLKAFSFIDEERKSSKYSMHRLVQLSTQKWLQHLDQVLFFQEAAISAVSLSCPPTPEFKDWPSFVDLGSHVSIVLEYEAKTRLAKINHANILHCFGIYILGQGQDNVALKFFEEACTLRDEHLGPEHEATLTTSGFLGVTYSKLGPENWRKARQIQIEVLAKSKRILGATHRLTLKSMSRLAITYMKEGNDQYCRELQVQVLRLMEQELGLNDPDTLTEMSNLLFTLNHLKEWDKADEVGQLALRLRSKVLGPAHPDTVTIMANLSWTYNAQQRWQEAVQLEEKVLKLRLRSLGPVHPRSLRTMANLARTYKNQNRLTEAKQLQQQVVASRMQVLGPDHKDTIVAMQDLKRYNEISLMQISRKSGSSRAVTPDYTSIGSPMGSRAESPVIPTNENNVCGLRE